MDFFADSGSTLATAMKMSRKFITIEQINRQIIEIDKRLNNVIHDDRTGISKEVDWRGGGSFVYTELMKENQGFLYDLQKATTIDELDTVYNRMKQGAGLGFHVDLDKFENDSGCTSLPFGDQKKLLIRLLDKNRLYYNEANIDDANVRDLISDSDYRFSKSLCNGKESK